MQDYNNQNYSGQNFSQNNNDPQQDPFSLDNPFFSKTQFRDMLVNMSFSQRENFENTLSAEFKNSTRMPSLKNKSTMLILSILPLIIPFVAVDRLYAGRIGSGLFKLFLPFIGIILGVILIISGVSVLNIWSATAYIGVVIILLTSLSVYVWNIVDTILSATGKQKDKYGRYIDI